MTEKELRIWMRREKAEDAWWVSIDGQACDEPMRLSSVFRRIRNQEAREVLVLHDSQKDAKDPPWVLLDPNSELNEDTRRELSKRQRISVGLVAQLLLLLIIGGAALYFILRPEPPPPPPPTDPLERVFEQMDSVEAEGGAEVDPEKLLPELRVAVASSGRIVYISNLSDVTWPSCEIILDGPDGYRSSWKAPIANHQTIHRPLREFLRDGEAFPREAQTPKSVTVLVPGYRPWEDDFR